ncbi:protein hold'em [Anopheles bellator]|uniref:protein hold'em n=1 Tax=Anopheles bellator TaxID=139047 RepID=UPI00264894AD|nr:protein hold'em [Anopheles bellator]
MLQWLVEKRKEIGRTEMFTVKKIGQLSEQTQTFALVALVIAKSDAHFFSGSPRNGSRFAGAGITAEHGSARGVLTLTLRDSDRDTINCTVWGTSDTMLRYEETIRIGTVVELHRPQIAATVYGRSEQYAPRVSSRYCLTVNDQSAEAIVVHTGEQVPLLRSLLHVPAVRPVETIPLADIVASGAGCNGETFCVLVVVRSIRPVRQIRIARRNEVKSFREVVLMDRSHSGVLLKLWSESYIRWADSWQPMATVLAIADARIEYSEYHKSIGLAIDRKTIVTQDPRVPEAGRLLQHAKTVPTNTVDVACSLSSGTVDPSTINTIMTVQQIMDRAVGAHAGEEDEFTALCYAVITRFDLDGPEARIVSQRCVHCRTFLPKQPSSNGCPKEDCPGRYDSASVPPEAFFDITVDISDHTGTLAGCRMMSSVAESVLRCDVATFVRKSDTQRTALKWQYLLDRFALRLVVKRRTAVRFQHLFSIVDCTAADPVELESKLKVY